MAADDARHKSTFYGRGLTGRKTAAGSSVSRSTICEATSVRGRHRYSGYL